MFGSDGRRTLEAMLACVCACACVRVRARADVRVCACACVVHTLSLVGPPYTVTKACTMATRTLLIFGEAQEATTDARSIIKTALTQAIAAVANLDEPSLLHSLQ